MIEIDKPLKNKSCNMSIEVNINRESDSKNVELIGLEQLHLSNAALSNLHPPGSALSQEESVVSSQNEQVQGRQSTFSDPIEFVESNDSISDQVDDSSSLGMSPLKLENESAEIIKESPTKKKSLVAEKKVQVWSPRSGSSRKIRVSSQQEEDQNYQRI